MATESVTIHLEPYATRGEWSGQTPFRAKSKRDTGPVAVLTRATLRWNAMLQFWKQSPAISTKIGMNEDVLFKIGLGEVPLRQQLTFSIWPDIKQMSEFAHQSDPHRSAIQKVRQGDWFKEELTRVLTSLRLMVIGQHLAQSARKKTQMNSAFPFSAIVGQDDMKLALTLTAIDPKIGGVLAFGDRGTGKSTAIRALADLLPNVDVVQGCPVNSERWIRCQIGSKRPSQRSFPLIHQWLIYPWA